MRAGVKPFIGPQEDGFKRAACVLQDIHAQA